MLSITDWAGDTVEVSLYEPAAGKSHVEVMIHPEPPGLDSRLAWLDATQARDVAAALLERAAELEAREAAALPEVDVKAALAAHTAAALEIINGGQA